ncbi:MAG: hypothetical protein ACRCXZ_04925 [Patescibacteria group bacterium]
MKIVNLFLILVSIIFGTLGIDSSANANPLSTIPSLQEKILQKPKSKVEIFHVIRPARTTVGELPSLESLSNGDVGHSFVGLVYNIGDNPQIKTIAVWNNKTPILYDNKKDKKDFEMVLKGEAPQDWYIDKQDSQSWNQYLIEDLINNGVDPTIKAKYEYYDPFSKNCLDFSMDVISFYTLSIKQSKTKIPFVSIGEDGVKRQFEFSNPSKFKHK